MLRMVSIRTTERSWYYDHEFGFTFVHCLGLILAEGLLFHGLSFPECLFCLSCCSQLSLQSHNLNQQIICCSFRSSLSFTKSIASFLSSLRIVNCQSSLEFSKWLYSPNSDPTHLRFLSKSKVDRSPSNSAPHTTRRPTQSNFQGVVTSLIFSRVPHSARREWAYNVTHKSNVPRLTIERACNVVKKSQADTVD